MDQPKRTCSICGGKHHAKGLCAKHYIPLKNKAHYEANKEAYAARAAAWRAENPEKVRAICKKGHVTRKEKRNAESRAYRAANREKVLEMQRAWYRANVPKQLAYNASRRAQTCQAAAAFQDEFNTFVIAEAFALSDLRSRATGITWHVDHIVPLKSKIVCGLHCAANIRVIPASENWSKGNRRWPHMPV